MAVTSEAITVGDVPTALNVASRAGQVLHLLNSSLNAADLGGDDVVATEGYPLAAAATAIIHLKPGDVLYAINTALYDDAVINVVVT